MIKVAAYTSGLQVPSARFRVRQLIGELAKNEVRVTEHPSPVEKYGQTYPPGIYYKIAARTGGDPMKLWLRHRTLKRWPAFAAARFADITWLERVLIPQHLTYETRLRKPLVFDLDDAIWMEGAEGHGFLDKILEHADMVFAGNAYLADWCSNYCKRVEVVHTAVDISRYSPGAARPGDKIAIGWIGTASNFPYLETVFGVLKKLLREFPQLEFHVCADKTPAFDGPRFYYTPWSETNEIPFLRALDIGLMPLPDDEWTRGKCSFKMLQYMACGIPAVVSPVGMNIQVLKDWNTDFAAAGEKDWEVILRLLIGNSDLRSSAGLQARKVIEEKYSSQIIARQVAGHFKSLR